jgi:hypothetical protein
MEITNARIENVNQPILIESLKEEFPDHHLYSSSNISVFSVEGYYFRVGSNLLSTVILDFTEKNTCKIEIISGGGARGLLHITWGSEGSQNSKIIKTIRKLCETNSWRLIEG